MIVNCEQCQTRYKLDDSKFEGKSTKKIKCPKCGHVFDVTNPSGEKAGPPAAPPPPNSAPESTGAFPSHQPGSFPRMEETTDMKEGRESAFLMLEDGMLELPTGKKLSLAIIQGNSQGKIFKLDKPRMTLGRASADIILNDMEVSRNHATVEVFLDKYILRDLNSTNGTYVDGAKIKMHPLDNHSEFRIGNTTLMLIVTGLQDEDQL